MNIEFISAKCLEQPLKWCCVTNFGLRTLKGFVIKGREMFEMVIQNKNCKLFFHTSKTGQILWA